MCCAVIGMPSTDPDQRVLLLTKTFSRRTFIEGRSELSYSAL